MVNIAIEKPTYNIPFSKHIKRYNIADKFDNIYNITDYNRIEQVYLIDPYFLGKKYASKSIQNLITLIKNRRVFENIIIYTHKPNKDIIQNLDKSEKNKLKNIIIYEYPFGKDDKDKLELHARYLLCEKSYEIKNIFVFDNSFDSLDSYSHSLDICEQTDREIQDTIKEIISSCGESNLIFKGGKYVGK